MKRAFDLALALCLVVPASLIIAAACVFIRWEGPGKVLFFQERIGRHRQIFRIVKLRTMLEGTAAAASHEVGASRITRVGAILRKTKIDELPQIYSVILGDMSFVGPRPCLPVQAELIAEREQRGVFAMRPGITGLAQIKGIDMSQPRPLAETDAAYCQQRSFAGDMRILFATVAGHGRGDAAV